METHGKPVPGQYACRNLLGKRFLLQMVNSNVRDLWWGHRIAPLYCWLCLPDLILIALRRPSCTSYVKPLLKKNSRSRLRTFQVSIQMEGQEETPRPQLIKKGSTTKMVLPWDCAVAEQVHQARRQSVAPRPLLPPGHSGGFSSFQLEALEEHNRHRCTSLLPGRLPRPPPGPDTEWSP